MGTLFAGLYFAVATLCYIIAQLHARSESEFKLQVVDNMVDEQALVHVPQVHNGSNAGFTHWWSWPCWPQQLVRFVSTA